MGLAWRIAALVFRESFRWQNNPVREKHKLGTIPARWQFPKRSARKPTRYLVAYKLRWERTASVLPPTPYVVAYREEFGGLFREVIKPRTPYVVPYRGIKPRNPPGWLDKFNHHEQKPPMPIRVAIVICP